MDQYLFAKLKCPHCAKGTVTASDADTLKCAVCGRVYPVVDGVPDLLPQSGRTVDVPHAPTGAEG